MGIDWALLVGVVIASVLISSTVATVLVLKFSRKLLGIGEQKGKGNGKWRPNILTIGGMITFVCVLIAGLIAAGVFKGGSDVVVGTLIGLLGGGLSNLGSLGSSLADEGKPNQ